MKIAVFKSMMLVIITLLTSFLWLRYPSYFPSVPEEQAIALARYFGSSNGEELANLEMYLVLFCSFIFSLLLVFFILKCKNLHRKQSR